MRRYRKVALGSLAFALLAFAASAQAGPPSHAPLGDPIEGFPLNHACGTAVDSEGDIYVSSAGNSKVEIFSPSGAHLTSIADAHEPCGLAVDSKGGLYVLERAVSKVVKYVPTEYPFVGAPSYGVPATIDGSGEAVAISVDPTDDRLFVAESDGIAVYQSDGSIEAPSNEVQRLRIIESTGGEYTLGFEGQTTVPLAYNAPCNDLEAGTPGTIDSVQEALEGLTAIGAGNVSVTAEASTDVVRCIVTFTGALHDKTLPQLFGGGSKLTGGSFGLFLSTLEQGFSGHIGEGKLSETVGVAAYTYAGGQRYVFAADQSTDEVKVFSGRDVKQLELRRTIPGSKVGEDFGFGAAGAYLAVDPGNGDLATKKCENPVAEQACSAGHLFVYDDAHEAVDEFDASGEFLDQIANEGFSDAGPTALAVDRSGGATDGRIYVGAGAGSGAKLLSFGPLARPERLPLHKLSRELKGARAVAIDSLGDVYVAAEKRIHVYSPDGEEISVGPNGEGIETTTGTAADLAVDSQGNVYTMFRFGGNQPTVESVQYQAPSSYPPTDGTQYGAPVKVANGNSFPSPATFAGGIGLDSNDDHLFFGAYNGQIIELASAAEGSAILNFCFACPIAGGSGEIEDVEGGRDEVYISRFGGGVQVTDRSGGAQLARIGGGGSPKGLFGGGPSGRMAVDQSNGHVLVFNAARGVAEEYDGTGGFVAEFGVFEDVVVEYRIGIDNSVGPGNGDAFIAYDQPGSSVDLAAFEPLTYGAPPEAATGIASAIKPAGATLNGTVKPHGSTLGDCHFEYLSDDEYEANGKTFVGATEAPCVEPLSEIGHGDGAVAVHADIGGIEPEKTRYRFRLTAENKYGPDEGRAGLFGPPLPAAKSALPVLYDEATLRAELDPSGLQTKYHFEYVDQEHYEAEGGFASAKTQSTSVKTLVAGEASVSVQAAVGNLKEGTEYHFRLLAENEAAMALGAERAFETLQRAEAPICPNAEYRTGLSANLPDCRAYELVTPAETEGGVPRATAGAEFNNWLIAPRGAEAGESAAFFARPLQGFEGSGDTEGYRASRGEGVHPSTGWTTEIASPSFALAGGGGNVSQHGVAADQRYWFYSVGDEGSLLPGIYLRAPGGLAESPCNPLPAQDRFELVGCGDLGTDPKAEGRYLSPGGDHVIFLSKEHLEEDAAPPGILSIYDRVAGSAHAEVISVDSGGSPLTSDANFLAATEDGSAVVFKAGGTLYLHRRGKTTEIAAAPNAFAGVSSDSKRVFFAAGSGSAPATLFACEVDGASACTEIAEKAIFVNVSDDGSHAFFSSEEVLTGGEENGAGESAEGGKPNLYGWDGVEVRFIATLDPQDLSPNGFGDFIGMPNWSESISAGIGIGRDRSPTRSTPDGKVLAFQSHAQLTTYDNKGLSEIYRYEPTAAPDTRLSCVSCDPTSAPPSAEAKFLLNSGEESVVLFTTLVPNLTDDGGSVFFQSPDQLLSEDANSAQDVYEWKAPGSGNPYCGRSGGCLALISSGQGEENSYLYGMSASGHDVFFETSERLAGQDIAGSPSIYDARVEGGIPNPPTKEVCHGDACQGHGSVPPMLPSPASTGSGGGNVASTRSRRCPKGKRKARRKGQVRCIAKHSHKRQHRRAANKRGSKR